MMTYAYAALFLIGMGAFFYTSSKEFKKIDQALWTLIIMVQFINLGYAYLAMAQTPREAIIANAFVDFEGTIYPVVCLYAALNVFKASYSNLVKRILYLIGFAILLMEWHGIGDGGFYIRSFELEQTPFGIMERDVPGPGMYIQIVFLISLFAVATVLFLKKLFLEKKRVPQSIIIAFVTMLVVEFIGYAIDTVIQLDFYIMPFVYVLTLWIAAIMYKRNLQYDVEELISRMNRKSDTVRGYMAFDFNMKYLGSTLKATELLPEVDNFIIDRKLTEDDSLLADSLIKAIEDFEKGDIKANYLNEKDTIIRYDVSYYSRGNDGENVGYLIEFYDDTINQKALALVREQEKMLEEAKIHEQYERNLRELLKETAEALAGAIDAKDEYTHGHSRRVAEYARKIAIEAGRNEDDCEEIYFSGLLHDVGKIGIRDVILTKAGRLTDEEYDVIKQHPVLGNAILGQIRQKPYLKVGAHYHHERYDGKGYPKGLKGEEIPEIARIIAVADAYDAMTSNRSYRTSLTQQIVREEFIKGIGTQFDPTFARIMLHLIDKDIEYDMQEYAAFDTEEERKNLSINENRSIYSLAMRITDIKSRIHFSYTKTAEDGMPSFVLYDSADAIVHKGDKLEKKYSYREYGEIKLDGSSSFDWVRATKVDISDKPDIVTGTCDIEIVKDSDHLYFEMLSEGKVTEGIVALPNNTNYVYISITGKNCDISNISDDHDDEPIKAGAIERIVDEISYLSGKEGDIPSIQVDGYRTASTEGILIEEFVEIDFEVKSLPFAERIWHCPYIIIYHSTDGKINGPGYREYGVVRTNGESWGEVDGLSNRISVSETEEFQGWDQWKEDNKQSHRCNVTLKKQGNVVILNTMNCGVVIENTTEVENDKDIYVAISGDQCVIEDIRRVY